MFNPTKLFRMMAAVIARKKEISSPALPWKRLPGPESHVANKGHFVVYTMGGRRFSMPLSYLNTSIFREILRLSEEEFGIPSDGPITLPCDGALMDYIVSIMAKGKAKKLEKALINSVSFSFYSSSAASFHQRQTNQQMFGATEVYNSISELHILRGQMMLRQFT